VGDGDKKQRIKIRGIIAYIERERARE